MENPLRRNSKWVSKFIAKAIACLAAVWVVVQFLWAVENSLKTDIDIFRPGAVFPFLQFTPKLDAWKKVLYDSQLPNCFFSSALVGLSTTVLVLLIGTPAAYSLARFEFKGMKSKDITLWFLSQRVFPPVVVLTPFYILLGVPIVDGQKTTLRSFCYLHPLKISVLRRHRSPHPTGPCGLRSSTVNV